MAIRREDEHCDERPDEQGTEQAEPSAIGQERVRPDMVAVAEGVIARRRSLLTRLAAYDRGESVEREDAMAIGRQVIAEDQALLRRLAEYDQGKDAGR